MIQMNLKDTRCILKKSCTQTATIDRNWGRYERENVRHENNAGTIDRQCSEGCITDDVITATNIYLIAILETVITKTLFAAMSNDAAVNSDHLLLTVFHSVQSNKFRYFSIGYSILLMVLADEALRMVEQLLYGRRRDRHLCRVRYQRLGIVCWDVELLDLLTIPIALTYCWRSTVW